MDKYTIGQMVAYLHYMAGVYAEYLHQANWRKDSEHLIRRHESYVACSIMGEQLHRIYFTI
jgi:hypothetical protein